MSTEVRPGFKQTELGLIPVDWEINQLGKICDVRDGTHDSPKFVNQGIPFITSKNIVNSSLDLEDVSYISTEDAYEFNKRSKVDKNDILMSMIGTIGNAAIVDFEPDFCIKNVALIKPRTINPFYLVQLINSSGYQRYIEENLDGGIQKFISLGSLRTLSILIPSTFEQSTITIALSEIDALISSFDQLIAKKRDIRQSTMQQLLTGQLRLPGFSGAWEVKRLGEVFDVFAGGDFDPLSSSSVQDELYPFPIYSNATTDSGLYGFSAYSAYSAYSITVTARGTLGFANLRETAFSAIGRVLVLQPKFELDGRFYSAFINSQINFVVESTGVPQLTAPQISKYELPIPPYVEQAAIATILSDMDDELTVLEARRNKAIQLKQGMVQKLLTGQIRLV